MVNLHGNNCYLNPSDWEIRTQSLNTTGFRQCRLTLFLKDLTQHCEDRKYVGGITGESIFSQPYVKGRVKNNIERKQHRMFKIKQISSNKMAL